MRYRLKDISDVSKLNLNKTIMKKQILETAVEWLVDYLKNIKELPFIRQNLNINEQNILNDIIEQAKEMEKEHIIEAYEQGYRDGETNLNTVNYGIDISKFADAKNYYNETFKSE